MSTLPFSISPDATAWLREQLREAGKMVFPGLVPALCFSFNYQNKDDEGRLFEWWPHPSVHIGWFPPQAVHGCLEIGLVDLKLLVPSETLERLEGKQLVLETVEVGYPTPSDKKRELLRVVPEGI